jgi:ring-1,2-phenylacetyl-CoA epoxidase subunit PaaE
MEECPMSNVVSVIFKNWFGAAEPPVKQRQPSARWSGVAAGAWAGSAGPAPKRANGRRPGPVSIRTPSARWGQQFSPQRPSHFDLEIAGIVEETPSTRTFVLKTDDAALLRYRAGQHLTVQLEIDGQPVRRCYSLSAPPSADTGHGGSLPITVKRIDGGKVSAYLCDTLQVGQTLRISGPAGGFAVTPDAQRQRRYLMVAGGVGITPIISMIEALLIGEPGSSVTLIYGSREQREIIFRERLEALAEDYPETLTVQLAIDQPEAGWAGLTGALSPERVVDALDDVATYDDVYLCGPAAMMDALIPALTEGGIPRHAIHAEHFAYADPTRVSHPTQSYNVRFARSGKSVVSTPGEALLQTALAAGVELAYSCQMGGCGQCKVQTVSGSAVMDEPNCLNAAEREAGYILTCCAYPSSDLVVGDR